MRVLAVVERAYRGAVETQYAHLPFVLRDLHRQLGEVVVLLRGPAVTLGLDGPAQPVLRLGHAVVDTLPDRRDAVRGLLDDGVAVFVDDADLRTAGLPTSRLLAGVRTADRRTLPWDGFAHVWFF